MRITQSERQIAELVAAVANAFQHLEAHSEQIKRLQASLDQLQNTLEPTGLPQQPEPPGFYGVYHEGWTACCRVHSIDWTPDEDERQQAAARAAFYNPANDNQEEGAGDG